MKTKKQLVYEGDWLDAFLVQHPPMMRTNTHNSHRLFIKFKAKFHIVFRYEGLDKRCEPGL